MKAPDLRRLVRDDMDLTTDSGIDQLFDTLNGFMEQVVLTLSGNLSLGDNISGRVLTASFTTPSDYISAPGAFNAFSMLLPNTTTLSVVQIGYLRKTTATTEVLIGAMTCQWTQVTQTSLRIDYITGLVASTRYNVRLLVF